MEPGFSHRISLLLLEKPGNCVKKQNSPGCENKVEWDKKTQIKKNQNM